MRARQGMKKIRIGIVGSCGRGSGFKKGCDALEIIEIRAVCDINKKKLPASAEQLGAREMYTDCETMVSRHDDDR
jgi:predicted dehydrogenase